MKVLIVCGSQSDMDVARRAEDVLKTNKIPAVKLVGQWRFKKDKIDAWLENRSVFMIRKGEENVS